MANALTFDQPALSPNFLNTLLQYQKQKRATTGVGLTPQQEQAYIEAGLNTEITRQNQARDYALRQRALDIQERSVEANISQQGITNELAREALDKEEKAATISGVGTLVTAGKTVYDMLTGDGSGGGGGLISGGGVLGTIGGGVSKLLGGGGPAISSLEGPMTVVGEKIGEAIVGGGLTAAVPTTGVLTGATEAAGIAAEALGIPAALSAVAPEVASEIAAMSAAYGVPATTVAPAAVQSTLSSVLGAAAPYALGVAGAAIAGAVISSAVTSHERGIERQEQSWYQVYANPLTKTVQAKIDELYAIDPRLGDLAKESFEQAGMDPGGILIDGKSTPGSAYGYLSNFGRPVYDIDQVPNGYGLAVAAPEAFRLGYDPFTPEGQEAYRAFKEKPYVEEPYTGY